MFLLKPVANISFSIPKNGITILLPLRAISRISFLFIFIFLSYSSALAQPCIIPIINNSFEIKPATCAGTVATLQGSTPLGGIGNYTYRWEMSLGNCGQNNFQPIPGATAKDYAVPAAADPNDCFRRVVISGNCTPSASGTSKVTLQDRTTPAPPATTVVQPTCTVGTGTITVTSPAPAAGISYSINGSTYTNTTGVFTALSPGTYSVTAKYPAGCISPAKSETINSVPTVTGTISPATVTFCMGSSQVLTVNGGTSYQWFRNGTLIAGATSATYTATTSGTYTANIINSTCTGAASNSSTVTVTPLPTGSITPATATICGGSSTTLTANGGSSYQWYKDNILITGATAATYSANQQGTYSADIITSGGCKAKASNVSVVTLTSLPSGSITPSSGVVCANGSLTLTVSGGSSYQWFKNGVAITGATAATYSVTTPGTYTATIISGTCSNPAANAVVITQGTTPSGFITPASGSICPGNTINLTTTTASGINTYQWYFNGNIIPGATAAVYNAAQTGSYSVIIFNNICSGPAANTVAVTPTAISFTTASTNPGCTTLTGSITITNPAGGSGNAYQYSKDNGINFQTGNTFTGLVPGTYQVVIKDTAGCNSPPNPVVINQFISTLTATATATNARCGQPNGSVSIQAAGGAPNYSYSLDNGAYQASNSFSNIAVGNHKATVKDAAGCLIDAAFVINQTGTIPNLVITSPPAICPDLTANLQASTITSGSDAGLLFTYWRDTGAITPLPNPGAVTEGTYYIKAANAAGCFTIKPVKVIFHTATAGNITTTGPRSACLGKSITLTSSAGTAYQWFRNDTIISGATLINYIAMTSGVYSVSINNGTCSFRASDTVRLDFQDCPEMKIFVPTAFTPNKNGANDVLRPVLYNVTELRYFKVYNRWGQEVFQTAVKGKGWDGTVKGLPQPAETYSWILECIDRNGETSKQSGRSLLIR